MPYISRPLIRLDPDKCTRCALYKLDLASLQTIWGLFFKYLKVHCEEKSSICTGCALNKLDAFLQTIRELIWKSHIWYFSPLWTFKWLLKYICTGCALNKLDSNCTYGWLLCMCSLQYPIMNLYSDILTCFRRNIDKLVFLLLRTSNIEYHQQQHI